jgi:hypothetical protein
VGAATVTGVDGPEVSVEGAGAILISNPDESRRPCRGFRKIGGGVALVDMPSAAICDTREGIPIPALLKAPSVEGEALDVAATGAAIA